MSLTDFLRVNIQFATIFFLDNSVKRKRQENFRQIKTGIDLTKVLSSSLCNTVQCTYHSVEIHEFLYHNYFQQSIKKFP